MARFGLILITYKDLAFELHVDEELQPREETYLELAGILSLIRAVFRQCSLGTPAHMSHQCAAIWLTQHLNAGCTLAE